MVRMKIDSLRTQLDLVGAFGTDRDREAQQKLKAELGAFLAQQSVGDKIAVRVNMDGGDMKVSPRVAAWLRDFEKRTRAAFMDGLRAPTTPTRAELEAFQSLLAKPVEVTPAARSVLVAFLAEQNK